MSDEKTIYDLSMQAEELKGELWAYMEKHKKPHKGIKEAMNELLDLIDELDL